MARTPLDPRKVNIGLDANALDLDGSDRDKLVRRFCELSAAGGTLRIVMSAGVRREVEHQKTPSYVQTHVLPQIFNLRAGPNSTQQITRRRVAAIIQGNASPGKHTADASHLSEADETGCGYFITHDKRILAKRGELAQVLSPSLNIVTLTEFFKILNDYLEGCCS